MNQIDYGKFLDAPYNDYSITENGDAYSHKRGKIRLLNPSIMTNGYKAISPSAKGLSRCQPTFYIHHLVAQYFIGPREEKQVVRHIDGDPLNNHVSNLEYGTQYENIQDTVKHGRVPKGESHYASKVNEELVLHIVEEIKAGKFYKDIAEQFGVGKSLVTQIAVGNTWTHVTGGRIETPNVHQKIFPAEREIIKARLQAGEKVKDLALEYNVTKALINKIRREY